MGTTDATGAERQRRWREQRQKKEAAARDELARLRARVAELEKENAQLNETLRTIPIIL